MNKLFAAIGVVVFVLAVATGLGLLLAWPTSYLINYVFSPAVLTAVFGTAKIGIVKTWALSVVTSLLFYRPSTKS